MSGRACGKVILLGEHAVVYGVPALAVGIDRGADATSSPSGPGPSVLRVRGWPIDARDDDEERDLSRAFGALLRETRAAGAALGPVVVEAGSDLPPGAGLGCSAALGVAVARALDPRVDERQAAERAMVWERVFHGNPSGIDAAVAAHGGCVLFEKERGFERVRARGALSLCVGHSGSASSTKAMVEAVARLRGRRPEVVDKSFEAIRAVVRNGRLAVEAGDRQALGQLMDMNQMLLSGLFVSTPEIERMCALARTAGAYGAKLTGAGGGGCVVALVAGPEIAAAVLSAWEADGFAGFATRVGTDEPTSQRAIAESAP